MNYLPNIINITFIIVIVSLDINTCVYGYMSVFVHVRVCTGAEPH
jgi:hypothetical protein